MSDPGLEERLRLVVMECFNQGGIKDPKSLNLENLTIAMDLFIKWLVENWGKK